MRSENLTTTMRTDIIRAVRSAVLTKPLEYDRRKAVLEKVLLFCYIEIEGGALLWSR